MRADTGASLARERAKALVCRKLFLERSEVLRLGRYELVRTLGQGGVGVVYEALDPLRDEPVALKTLHRRSPGALFQIKHEFRALAELSHPNLVSLHELHVEGREAYFTMELVRGRDFVSYVRDGVAPGECVRDEERMLGALVQLCEGIQALHAAGKLHRDLKPSNVLVNRAGRVVLLDFGLVGEVLAVPDSAGGTPGYMAPEQMRGAACTRSDWYSFGRMLWHTLNGVARADDGVVPSSGSRRHGALQQLARELMRDDPNERPAGEQVIARLLGRDAHGPMQRASRTRRALFVGREPELAQLSRALEESRTRFTLVLVRGESGIGKSALVRHFVQTSLSDRAALVLSGRCYERESVPYKALDSVIDALSRHLLVGSTPIELSAEERAALLHMFPVLGRVPALRGQLSPNDGLQPGVLWRRGVAALGRVLRALAAQRQLVVCIDDMQWSDADSGQLLGALACEGDAPPLLVIGSDRTDACLVNPAVEALEASCAGAGRGLATLQICLGPLSHAEATALVDEVAADELPASSARGAASLVSQLVDESRGNPLFLRELMLSASEQTGRASRGAHQLALDVLLSERIERLSPAQLSVLELIALAGRPVSAAVVVHAAGLSREPQSSFGELRRARLIHAVRRDGEQLLEIDHDRVALAVLRRLSHRERQALHVRLARALEAVPSVHSESLVDEYMAAAMPAEAARHARHAGHLAFAALAFSRAATLYRQALQLGRWGDHERRELLLALARALEHSGRGIEAADAYSAAASSCRDQLTAAQLECSAAEHLLNNGHHRAGARTLARCYAALGLWWPRGGLLLALALVGLFVRLWLGRCRADRPRQALHRARAEVLGKAGASLEGWNVPRALYNALLAIAAAERTDDASWRARALGTRALLACAGFPLERRAPALLRAERASRSAAVRSDLDASTQLEGLLAWAHLVSGDARAALAHAQRCEQGARLLSLPPSVLHNVMGVVGSALLELGELREAGQRWRALAHEARHHGDLVASYWIHAHPVRFAMFYASDDRAGARAVLARLERLRREHPHFTLVAWTLAACRIETELYWGTPERAACMLAAEWRTLNRGGYGFLDELVRLLRTRLALGCAAALPAGAARSRLVRLARADARKLRRGQRPNARGAGLLAEAGAALLAGDVGEALRSLASAQQLLEASGSKLLAASAHCCRGALIGGPDGCAEVDAALTTLRVEGIEEPVRWVVWFAPAFRASLSAYGR